MKTKEIRKIKRWTDADNDVIKNNMDAKLDELQALLPERSRSQITARRVLIKAGRLPEVRKRQIINHDEEPPRVNPITIGRRPYAMPPQYRSQMLMWS